MPGEPHAALRQQTGLNEEPEADGDRVEATGDQAPVERLRRGLHVQVEGLRVELHRVVDDAALGERDATGRKDLAHREIIEVSVPRSRRSPRCGRHFCLELAAQQ